MLTCRYKARWHGGLQHNLYFTLIIGVDNTKSPSLVVEECPINKACISFPRGTHTPAGTKCTEEVMRVTDSLAAKSSPALPVVTGTSLLAKCFASHFFDSAGCASLPPASSFWTVWLPLFYGSENDIR